MRKFLTIVLTIIFLIFVYYALSTYNEEQNDNAVYEEIDQYIETESPLNSVEIISEYQVEYDWDSLLNINSDIVGWICIPGNEKVNFPVVQGKDNSYYLNHDYKRQWNKNGAAFVDHRVNELSLNKVIYGHNMNLSTTKPVFTTLVNYWEDESYFNSHKTVYYTEANGMTKKYQVVGVAWFNIAKEKELSYLNTFFDTEEELQSWVEYMRINSIFFDLGDIEIDYRADEVLTLSTCYRRAGAGKNGRLVLLCVNLTNNELDGGR